MAVGAALQIGLGLAGKAWAIHRAVRRARALLPVRKPVSEGRRLRGEDDAFEVTEVVVVRRWRSSRDG